MRHPSALAIVSGKNRTFMTDARYRASSPAIMALSMGSSKSKVRCGCGLRALRSSGAAG
jgi:hypothetical protein